jgi:hypothetical protein
MASAPATEKPKGLLYRPDLIDCEDEAALLRLVEHLDFRELTMRGQTARRAVRLLRDRCAALAGLAVDLDPRAGDVLGGSARWAWQRSIPPTKPLRYSITFRSLRQR